ncbi:MAG: alcohol dehydrogenase catalytic domain-containing protein [Chloroflexia bacterium]
MIARRIVLPGPFAVEVESFELADPGPGELLIETEASAVSPGTELAIYTGVHQWLQDPARTWPKFPFVPGYSAVGSVLEVGADVEGFAPGDRVVWPGRHADHALVAAPPGGQGVWKIGEGVSTQAAACVVLARFPLTALVRTGDILGSSVAVLGLGMIGQLALRLYCRRAPTHLSAWTRWASGGSGRSPYPESSLWTQTPATCSAPCATPPGRAPRHRGGRHRRARRGSARDVGGRERRESGDGRQPEGIAGDVDFYHDLHGRSLSLIGAHGSALGVEPREKFPYTLERGMRLLRHFAENGKLSLDDLCTHHVHASNLGEIYEGLLGRREEFLGVVLHWRSSD